MEKYRILYLGLVECDVVIENDYLIQIKTDCIYKLAAIRTLSSIMGLYEDLYELIFRQTLGQSYEVIHKYESL